MHPAEDVGDAGEPRGDPDCAGNPPGSENPPFPEGKPRFWESRGHLVCRPLGIP